MSRQLQIEILKNFLLKTKIMMGVFVTIVFFQVVFGSIAISKGLVLTADIKRAVFVPLFLVVILASEYFVFRYVKTRLNENAPVKNHFLYAVSFLEISFPTMIMAFGAIFMINPDVTPYMVLNSPPELMYFIFLLAASLLLDSRLCYFLGVIIAVEYLLLCTTLLRDAADIEFIMTMAKAFLFLLSGVLTGILSKTIRNSVISSLESQRVLIEELDTKVSEKTAELNLQKEIVEEKQREILGSIAYAKRLQQAILATPEEITKHIPENFLLYKPKDVVAGDFYFFETTSTHLFIAAADCTGHGVPGAMVSIVCSNALTRCVREFQLSDPAKILDKARELVVETFEKSGQDVKDGMDISLFVMNINTKGLTWAGANNPLWYVESGKMKEIKGNKQPIGKVENPTGFTSHAIPKEAATTVYLLTDGYADQFGGPKGKKFKYKQLYSLLEANAHKAMDEQMKLLDSTIESWRGNLEQVDDICIIGFRC